MQNKKKIKMISEVKIVSANKILMLKYIGKNIQRGIWIFYREKYLFRDYKIFLLISSANIALSYRIL